jgi:hypothetical protein
MGRAAFEERTWRLLERLWPLGLATFWGLVSARHFTESDLFWHLMLGRGVLSQGTRIIEESSAWNNFSDHVVVQEWLWDVLAYWLWQHAGFLGLGWMVVLLAAAAAAACWLLLQRTAPGLPLPATLWVTATITPLVLTRIRERPEAAAMVLLPLTLVLAFELAEEARPRSLWVRAGGLALTTLLWVQIHPSSILAVPCAAIVLGAELLRGNRAAASAHDPLRRAVLAGTPVLLFLLQLSGAHGFGFAGNLLAHGSGYAVDHIFDMMPPSWDLFHPGVAIHLALYAVTLAASVWTGLRQSSRPWVELALALLGAAILTTARRGTGPAGVLLIPLLGRAAASWFERGRSSRAALGLSLLFSGYVGYRTVQFCRVDGPLLAFGLHPTSYPLAAAKWLEAAPAGSKALTSFQAGAPLGFLLEGRVRTFVDSRTPLLFDDAEYAMAGALWYAENALERGERHFHFRFAVTERSSKLCNILESSKEWAPVVVEPGFTTFERRSERMLGKPLDKLSACGSSLTADAACDPPRQLLEEIERMAPFQSDAFSRLLRAEQQIRCAASELDGDALWRLLPTQEEALGFTRPRARMVAWLLAWSGRVSEAADTLAPYAARGDEDVLLPVLPVLAKPEHARVLRPLLEAVFESRDQATPGFIHAHLANACAQSEDAPCATLHGYRAAMLGEFETGPALCWLSRAHPAAKVRTEAERWLVSLRREAAGNAAGRLECAPSEPP